MHEYMYEYVSEDYSAKFGRWGRDTVANMRDAGYWHDLVGAQVQC